MSTSLQDVHRQTFSDSPFNPSPHKFLVLLSEILIVIVAPSNQMAAVLPYIEWWMDIRPVIHGRPAGLLLTV